MANEVTGKTIKYLQNSTEHNITGFTPDLSYAMADITSSGTAADGMESVALRNTFGLTIDAILYNGSSNEVTGKTLAITVGGSSFLCTAATYDVAYTTEDITNSGTDSDSTEVIGIRQKITSTVDAIMKRDTADLLLGSAPTSQAIVLTFDTGVTVTGNGIINQESISAEVNGLVTVSYSIEWQGVPTELLIGSLTMNTSQSFEVIFETGVVANKEITGNIILTGKTVTAGINDVTTISYTGQATGAITKAIYAVI